MSRLSGTFEKVGGGVSSKFRALSPRERAYILLMFIACLLVGLVSSVEKLGESTKKIDREIYKMSSLLEQLEYDMKRMKTLESRSHDLTEKFVREPSGIGTKLERLVKRSLGVIPRLREPQVVNFAENYNLHPYEIRFNTDDLAKVLTLLKLMREGDDSFLISRVDLKKLGKNNISVLITANVISSKA